MSTFLMSQKQQQQQQQQNFYICEIKFAYLVNFLFFRCFCCYFYIFTGIWQKTEFYLQLTSFYGPYDAIAAAGKLLVNLKGH